MRYPVLVPIAACEVNVDLLGLPRTRTKADDPFER